MHSPSRVASHGRALLPPPERAFPRPGRRGRVFSAARQPARGVALACGRVPPAPTGGRTDGAEPEPAPLHRGRGHPRRPVAGAMVRRPGGFHAVRGLGGGCCGGGDGRAATRRPTQKAAPRGRPRWSPAPGSALVPIGLLAAALLYASRAAFAAPPAPALRPRAALSGAVAVRGGGDSVPTGLVFPSPGGEALTREVDGIKLYSTHVWSDGGVPVSQPLSRHVVALRSHFHAQWRSSHTSLAGHWRQCFGNARHVKSSRSRERFTGALTQANTVSNARRVTVCGSSCTRRSKSRDAAPCTMST